MTQYNNYQTINNLTLVGVFAKREQIENALIGLSAAGYKPDVITVLEKEITPEQKSRVNFEVEKTHQANFPAFLRTVMVGAITGGLLAGSITLVTKFWSLQLFELMEAGLAGAIIGASVGTLAVGFNKLGLLLNQLEEEVKGGQSKSPCARISINVADEKTLEEVRAILVRNGAYGTRFYKAAVPLPVLRARL